MRPVLIVRPPPGADRSAARAGALGLHAIVAPIFTVEPRAWQSPDPSGFEAVLLTSPNAARLAGAGLKRFTHLPAYAVGEASAAAAREAGFGKVRTGPSDMAALVEMARRDGVSALLHTCGEHHLPSEWPDIRMERRIVYVSNGMPQLPANALAALRADAVVTLHSPRAAAVFRSLAEAAGLPIGSMEIAAISQAAAASAGPGWKSASVAPEPRDHALLEVTAKLCKTGSVPNGK